MVARLQVMVDRFQDVLAVPLSVIQMENRRSFVWVKGEDGPEKREVQIAKDNGIVAVVEAGLSEGEQVASKTFGVTK